MRAALAAVVVAIALAGCAPTAPSCDTRLGTECTDIPLDELEESFGVDLPEGTSVIDSAYTDFQDWRLTATFDLPDGDWALPDGWADAEPGVNRSAQRDGDRLTLVAFTT